MYFIKHLQDKARWIETALAKLHPNVDEDQISVWVSIFSDGGWEISCDIEGHEKWLASGENLDEIQDFQDY